MPEFSRATRKPAKPTAEPPGLEAFASAASNVHVLKEDKPAEPAKKFGRETHGMNVRFTQQEIDTLRSIAENEERSVHRVIKRLLGPAIASAAQSSR